tara:strand:+ start:410 stop:775 length:366 start_codon:yes stop_codon:yes gene_type:complete
MTDTFILDKDGNEVNTSGVTIPSNRLFRNSWVLNGSVIEEDLTKAKDIFRNKIRQVRKELLDAKDVEYMKALETGANTSAIITAKQSLRDAPSASAIDNATTIAELKAAWDTNLLGDNPYS